MNPKTKVVFVGPVPPPERGPSVKNAVLIGGLIRVGAEVRTVNTLQRSWPEVVWRLVRAIVGVDVVVLATSMNGTRALAPLLAIVKVCWPRLRLISIQPGGNQDLWLQRGLFNRCIVLRSLCLFELVFFEQSVVVAEMLRLGVRARFFPNVRNGRVVVSACLNSHASLSVVYASRITRDKGVVDLLEAAETAKAAGSALTLTLYGRIEKGFDAEFRTALDACTVANYGGVLTAEDVAQVLESSDVSCLFTRSEGMPGAVIEALIAGCGVVISRYRGCDDLEGEPGVRIVQTKEELRLALQELCLRKVQGGLPSREEISSGARRKWTIEAWEDTLRCLTSRVK